MKKIMAILLVPFISFVLSACSGKSADATIDTGGDASEYCITHASSAFCEDTNGKSPEDLLSDSHVYLEFSTISGREDIPSKNEGNSKIFFSDSEEWKAGWDFSVSKVSDIRRLKHMYYVYRTNPEGGEILGNLIRVYYDQDGNRLTSFFYLASGAGQSTLASDGASVLDASTRDFDTITEIYEVVFFGNEISGVADFDKATSYYIMPTMHLKRPNA